MTSAVALREDTQEVVPVTGLGRWAQEARQASAVAVSLAKTPFVPASLRDRANAEITAANITAAILTGQELGLEPMAALRSIDVIQGTPALRAMTMRAVALAHGHDMWVVESTATRAIVRGRRKGSEHDQESVWTLDRAKGLGLAGKDNWRKQPAAMLVARATAECARLIAADALLGMPYAIEELNDGGDVEAAEPATPAAEQPRRTAQRRTRQQPAAVHRPPVKEVEPPADPEPDFGDDEATSPTKDAAGPQSGAESGEDSRFNSGPAPDPITEAQIKKVQVLYRELEVEDRDERLADVGSFVGRDVASTTELTKDEATRLIDDLERRISGMTPEESAQLFGGEPS